MDAVFFLCQKVKIMFHTPKYNMKEIKFFHKQFLCKMFLFLLKLNRKETLKAHKLWSNQVAFSSVNCHMT